MNYKDENEAVQCLECGKDIEYGRADKKFCCDSCKNRWHNRKKSYLMRLQSKVIHGLDKNYRILDELVKKEKSWAPIGDLVQWGFNPEYVTGVTRNRMRIEYRCYDIKYCRSESRIYNICKVAQQ